MRLFELITHTKTTVDDDNDDLEGLESQALGDPEESNFSFVVPDEDPHMVRKYNKSYDASYEDGFVQYAGFVVEYELWDKSVNFPRIYNTTETHSAGDSRYDWRIEKLTPWHEVSEKEFAAMIERYFVGPDVEEYLKPRSHAKTSADSICNLLKAVLEGRDKVSVQDEELMTALAWLRRINETYAFKYYDIHKDNVMYRRTPVGLQLVFTDPFGFKSS